MLHKEEEEANKAITGIPIVTSSGVIDHTSAQLLESSNQVTLEDMKNNSTAVSPSSSTRISRGSHMKGRMAKLIRQVSRKHRSPLSTVTRRSAPLDLPASYDAGTSLSGTHPKAFRLRPPIVARNSIEVAKARAAKLLKRTYSLVSRTTSSDTGESDKTTVYTRPGEKLEQSSVDTEAKAESRQSSIRFRERQKRSLLRRLSNPKGAERSASKLTEHATMPSRAEDIAAKEATASTVGAISSREGSEYQQSGSMVHLDAFSPSLAAEAQIEISDTTNKSQCKGRSLNISAAPAPSAEVMEFPWRLKADEKSVPSSFRFPREASAVVGATSEPVAGRLDQPSVEEATMLQLVERIGSQLATIPTSEERQRAVAPLCDIVQQIQDSLPDKCFK